MSQLEEGFDETEGLGDEDVLEVAVDGAVVRCVLLALVEEDGTEYAVLQPLEDADADLLVARATDGGDGGLVLTPLEDQAELDRVRGAITRILPLADDDGP